MSHMFTSEREREKENYKEGDTPEKQRGMGREMKSPGKGERTLLKENYCLNNPN